MPPYKHSIHSKDSENWNQNQKVQKGSSGSLTQKCRVCVFGAGVGGSGRKSGYSPWVCVFRAVQVFEREAASQVGPGGKPIIPVGVLTFGVI